METLEIVKARPVPEGYWKESDKWAILRVMRESTDFIVAVRQSDGKLLPFFKKEIIGKTLSIKGATYILRPDNKITRVHIDVTT